MNFVDWSWLEYMSLSVFSTVDASHSNEFEVLNLLQNYVPRISWISTKITWDNQYVHRSEWQLSKRRRHKVLLYLQIHKMTYCLKSINYLYYHLPLKIVGKSIVEYVCYTLGVATWASGKLWRVGRMTGQSESPEWQRTMVYNGTSWYHEGSKIVCLIEVSVLLDVRLHSFYRILNKNEIFLQFEISTHSLQKISTNQQVTLFLLEEFFKICEQLFYD